MDKAIQTPDKNAKTKKISKHCFLTLILFVVIGVIAIVALLGAGWANFSLYKHHLLGLKSAPVAKTNNLLPVQARISQLQSQIDQLNASINEVAQKQSTAAPKSSGIKPLASAPTFMPIDTKQVQADMKQLYSRLASFNIEVALAQANVFGHLKSAKASVEQAKTDLMKTGHDTAVNMLNQTLLELDKLPPVNMNHLLAQIDQAQKGLAKLSFKPPVTEKDLQVPETAQETAAHTSKVKAALNQSWHKIKGLLVVRHGNTVGQKLLTDSARVAAIASIRMQLQYARFYAIRHDAALYQVALKRASDLVNMYCQPNAASKAWQAQIHQLASFPIAHRLAVLKHGLEQVLTQLSSSSSHSESRGSLPVGGVK